MPEGLRVLEGAAALRLRPAADADPLGQLRPLCADRSDDAGRLEGPAAGLDALCSAPWAGRPRCPTMSLWGSLLKFRREFDQYINLRPVRLFDGVPCPLAGRKPGDIDHLIVRETPRANTPAWVA